MLKHIQREWSNNVWKIESNKDIHLGYAYLRDIKGALQRLLNDKDDR